MNDHHKSTMFARFATWVSHATGHSETFILSLIIIVGWAITGPMFKFSDSWQLVINTGTTIITFLMVFIIQNTQNRDSVAMQLKLDEIIRSISNANNALLNMEELDDKELQEMRNVYLRLAERAQQKAQSRQDKVKGAKPENRPEATHNGGKSSTGNGKNR